MPTINGISPKQTITSFKHSEQAQSREVLRRSWNQMYASGTVNNKERVLTPFRAVNNLGDFLGRINYSSGGPNAVKTLKAGTKKLGGSVPDDSDGTNVPASSTNVKFVPDSSDYIKYKKQAAMNRNYNDSSFGGDQHNASFVPMGRARR